MDNELIYMEIIRHHKSNPNWHGNKIPTNKIEGFIENIDAVTIFLLKNNVLVREMSLLRGSVSRVCCYNSQFRINVCLKSNNTDPPLTWPKSDRTLHLQGVKT